MWKILIDQGCKISWHILHCQDTAVLIGPFWAPKHLLVFLLLYDSQECVLLEIFLWKMLAAFILCLNTTGLEQGNYTMEPESSGCGKLLTKVSGCKVGNIGPLFSFIKYQLLTDWVDASCMSSSIQIDHCHGILSIQGKGIKWALLKKKRRKRY